MATFLGLSEKKVRPIIYTMKYLQFGKKFMKIGPVDTEIFGLKGIINTKLED